MFVYGDVVYAQTWEVLTLKNCIEPRQGPHLIPPSPVWNMIVGVSVVPNGTAVESNDASFDIDHF